MKLYLTSAIKSLAVGETRVDLQHLLEDLRDAYTASLEESIITELVANALDAGASDIRHPKICTIARGAARYE